MLSVPEKKVSSTELSGVSSLETFAPLRQARLKVIEKPPQNPSLHALSARLNHLVTYRLSLIAVVDVSRTKDIGLSFIWHDAFKPSQNTPKKCLDMDSACVIFNIGAVHSQIGAAVDRGTDAGRKKACKDFQKAAGAFGWVKKKAESGEFACFDVTVDLNTDCASMLENLMLAQAQECVFDTAVASEKSPAACSKVAMQVCYIIQIEATLFV